MTSELDAIRRRLVGHGAILIFLGGVLGFGFLFFLLGEIKLWPIPGALQVDIPGTYDAWRMAHLEGILNGFALWLTAALLPVLPFTARTLGRIATGLIIVGWTFVVASSLDPLFNDSRGLAFGGPMTNQIAFFLFYVGVLLVMGIMAMIAWRCLRPGKISPDDR